MKRVNLLVTWHHHQPVGNLPESVEYCYQQTYLPILEAMEEAPELKFNLHYTGPLLEYLLQHHTDFLAKLRYLLASGRVEMLSGGFYNPVLADLHHADRVGQVTRMNGWMLKELGYEPGGIWLAESVWEPSIIPALTEVNLRYTLLASDFFHRIGLTNRDLNGYYLTEHLGEVLKVFPIDSVLSEKFMAPDSGEFFSILRRVANRESDTVITLVIDTDRWGNFPGSPGRLQKASFLRELFATIRDNRDWIRLLTFQECLDQYPHFSRVDLPAGVRAEMGGWSLVGAAREKYFAARNELLVRHDAHRFVSSFYSGSWAGFRARYCEANLMMQKMRLLRTRLMEMEECEVKRQLMEEIWASQCNAAFWFGSFGGIYLPHLRTAKWERLLKVEQALRRNQTGWRVDRTDLDTDGDLEVLVSSREASLGFKPDYGGTCFEMSLLRAHVNLCNTLTRQHEQGEASGTKASPGGPKTCVVDTYQRHCFLDHLFARGATAEQLAEGQVVELGSFLRSPYRVVRVQGGSDGGEMDLERKGELRRLNQRQPVLIRKRYKWEGRDQLDLLVSYEIVNVSPLPLEAVFATEMNLFVLSDEQDVESCWIGEEHSSLSQLWEKEGIKAFRIVAPRAMVEFEVGADAASLFWMYPIRNQNHTSPMAEGARQGNAFLLGRHIDISPAEAVRLEFRVQARSLR